MNQAPTTEQTKGFLSRLFDFSFQSFITGSVIRILYILFVAVAGLATLGFIAAAATSGAAGLVLSLLIAPIVFLFYVMMARVWLEIVMVLFRIAENVEVIARNRERSQ